MSCTARQLTCVLHPTVIYTERDTEMLDAAEDFRLLVGMRQGIQIGGAFRLAHEIERRVVLHLSESIRLLPDNRPVGVVFAKWRWYGEPRGQLHEALDPRIAIQV